MSLVRLFMTTAYLLAINGQWQLLGEYFTLVGKVLSAPEGMIVAGAPKDKPV